MPWQAFHKRRPSNCLPAIGVHAGHPPLTSLRSFAPPYAEAKGAYDARQYGTFRMRVNANYPSVPQVPPFAKRKGG